MPTFDTIGKGAGSLDPVPRRLYLAWLGGFLSGLLVGLGMREEGFLTRDQKGQR